MSSWTIVVPFTVGHPTAAVRDDKEVPAVEEVELEVVELELIISVPITPL